MTRRQTESAVAGVFLVFLLVFVVVGFGGAAFIVTHWDAPPKVDEVAEFGEKMVIGLHAINERLDGIDDKLKRPNWTSIPEHVLLVRHGDEIHIWQPRTTVTVCQDGRIYGPTNYRNPCRGYSKWEQP